MAEQLPSRFTIRVYGLIINHRNEVLVTDEFQLGMAMTKFPGGGMHFGEGTLDCLKREMMEECGQEIEEIRHFYTTDFYQKALFWDDYQLMSIYYLARLKEPVQVRISTSAFDFEQMTNGNQSFRWVSIGELNTGEFTFPIDKHVALLLKQYLTGHS
ncbi:MAG TPA: NUDIX hydrolase [Prolixibacteraceae bacterium]|jgi:ADP-ribose pyrophosphatase YjhB (NUDIX family)|nr:NUDIX hydrolase [Prolixibacteraceae bacterium]